MASLPNSSSYFQGFLVSNLSLELFGMYTYSNFMSYFFLAVHTTLQALNIVYKFLCAQLQSLSSLSNVNKLRIAHFQPTHLVGLDTQTEKGLLARLIV